MQSVCGNTEINCNKLVKILNLFLSAYTEKDTKQKFKFTAFRVELEPHRFEIPAQIIAQDIDLIAK